MDYLTNTQKYTPELKINPKMGGKGEFYLFQLIESEKTEKVVFSNSSLLHPSAVNGRIIEETKYLDIEKNLKI